MSINNQITLIIKKYLQRHMLQASVEKKNGNK